MTRAPPEGAIMSYEEIQENIDYLLREVYLVNRRINALVETNSQQFIVHYAARREDLNSRIVALKEEMNNHVVQHLAY